MYSVFTPPHGDLIPTEALADDYAHLAGLTRKNPSASYYVRYRHDGSEKYGVLEGDEINELSDHYFANPQRTGKRVPLSEVRLLAPLDPNRVSKVVGVAMNTITPDLSELPANSHPRWFSKLPTSITGPGGGVEVPDDASELIHEAEVVVVIGKAGRNISREDALSYVWGVTAGNDMTEFSWFPESGGRATPSRLMAKAGDTFAPIGPAIVVGIDYSDLMITHRLNGQVTQQGGSAARLQQIPELIAHISRFSTLLPGDLIFTGAAPFVAGAQRTVKAGDELVVEVENIGILRNRTLGIGPIRW